MPVLTARATVNGGNLLSTQTSSPVVLMDGYGIIQATRYGLESNGPFVSSQVEFLLDPELLDEHINYQGGNPTGGLITAPYRVIFADGTTFAGTMSFGTTHLGTLYTLPDNGFMYSINNEILEARGGSYTIEIDINTTSNFVYSNSYKREPALVTVFASWITPQAPGAGSTIYLKESRGVSHVEHRGTIMAGGQETIVARVHFKRAFKNKEAYHAETNCFAAQGLGQMWAPSDYIDWGTRRGIIKQQFNDYVDVWQNKVITTIASLITFSATGIAYK